MHDFNLVHSYDDPVPGHMTKRTFKAFGKVPGHMTKRTFKVFGKGYHTIFVSDQFGKGYPTC